MAAADTQVCAIAGDDETVEQIVPGGQRQHHRQLLDGGMLVDHQGRMIHEQLATLAAEQLAAKRAGKAVDHAVTVDHADRLASLHDRQDLERRIGLEALDHCRVAGMDGNGDDGLEQAAGRRQAPGAARHRRQRQRLLVQRRQGSAR
ncbi:hypothetical protein SDC9_157270 [bioreactor metagenome]|uniref:Uncharacterized protein n=1 Tax=bioreactor metagenome TaxID=1076179 RepID=A0A645F702_9ZZZZ